MNTNIKTAAKLAAFAGAFALTGCAFVPDTVHPTYTPPANVAKIPGADKVTVDVVVKNEKKHKNEVSVTKDGYGFKMAGVYMNVSKDIKMAIEKGLEAKGFNVGNSGESVVNVTVKKFYLTERIAWNSTNHFGYLNWLISVKGKNGKDLYHSHIKISGLLYHVGDTLDTAGRSASAKHLLQKAVSKMMHDQQFINALLKCSDSSAQIGGVIPNIK